MCRITYYNCIMILNIRHKGLLLYYETGNGSKLPATFLRKINRILDQLDAATSTDDILQMGQGIHKLSGELVDFWSIKITPNYRIIFRFENAEILDVDFIDYH